MKRKPPGIGVVAPSSVVPRVEFELGIERLRSGDLRVEVHPQCFKRSLYLAGDDVLRAEAFFEYAVRPDLPVIWCARGGYGAARLLPILDHLSTELGIPGEKKLLVGYSDATALLEFVRARWGWSALHAPMPGLRDFAGVKPADWRALEGFISGKIMDAAWSRKRLRWLGRTPSRAIEGVLVGGNLSVWASLCGTPFEPRARDKILFFEDVSENFYRMDRMLQQLAQSGGLDGVAAIVLGTFEGCQDAVPKVMASRKGSSMKPLRATISLRRWLEDVVGGLGDWMGIPVAYGLGVGHGRAGQVPLPIGGRYRLSADGRLELLHWDWTERKEEGAVDTSPSLV